jgi:hypothetical protein
MKQTLEDRLLAEAYKNVVKEESDDVKYNSLQEVVVEAEKAFTNHPNIIDQEDWIFVCEELLTRAQNGLYKLNESVGDGYEFDEEVVIAGNKKYYAYANFDYGTEPIGHEHNPRTGIGVDIMADVPIGIQPNFKYFDYETDEPVHDQGVINAISDAIFDQARNDERFIKNKYRE